MMDVNKARGSAKRAAWGLGLAVAAGAVLRLYGLTDRAIWYDEANTFLTSEFVNAQFDWVRRDISLEQPLLFVVVRAWYGGLSALFGVTPGTLASDWLFRLMPALFGVATIPVVYGTARAWLRDGRAAVAAAWVYALSPFHIYYAQEVRMYFLLVPLLAGALWAFHHVLTHGRTRDWAVWTACLALALYDHPITLFYIAAFNLGFLVGWPWHRRPLGHWVLSQVALLVVCLPALYLLFRLDAIHATGEGAWYPRPTLKTALITFKAFFAGYSPHAAVYWPLFALAAGLCLLGCARERGQAAVQLVLALAVPILIGVVVWQLKAWPMYELRLFIGSAVPAALLVGAGWAAIPWRVGRVLAAAAFAGLTMPALADYYAQRIHPVPEHRLGVRHKVASRDAAAAIRAAIEPGDVVAHSSHFTSVPFLYYLRPVAVPIRRAVLGFTQKDREDMYRSMPVADIFERLEALPQRVETAVGDADRVWLVVSWWEVDDLPSMAHELVGWFDAHFVREVFWPFDGLAVYRYRRVPDRGLIPTDRVADAGDVPLVDYRFDVAPGVAPGVAAAWPAHYAAMAEALPDTSSGVYAVSMERRPGVSGGSLYRVEATLRNLTNHPVTLHGSHFQAAAVADAFSFVRENPTADVWRPGMAYNPAPPPRFFRKAGMVATLRADGPASGELTRRLSLPPGRYAVLTELLQVEGVENTQWGAARFEVAVDGAAPVRLGEHHGHLPSGVGGWVWRRTGTLDHLGGPLTLRVTAYNPDGLEEALFVFYRVAFIEAERARGDGPGIEAFEMPLAAGESKSVVFDGAVGRAGRSRLTLDVNEYGSKEMRTVHVHVETGQ